MNGSLTLHNLFLGLQDQTALSELIANTSVTSWFLIALALVGVLLLPPRLKIIAGITALALFALEGGEAFVVVLTLLATGLAVEGLVRVPEGTMALVERLGRYHRTLNPGINFIVPGVDSIKDLSVENKLYTVHKRESVPLYQQEKNRSWISTKEQLLDPQPKDVICRDNTEVKVDSIAYFVILDPESAVYNIDSLGSAMNSLLETSLRQEVGKLDGDAVLVSRGPIGVGVQAAMETATEAWGVRVVRVEVEDIVFTANVQAQLSQARQSELAGRADIAAAERERDAEVARAEGDKKANVLRAEGQFEKDRLKAEGNYLLELKARQGEAEGLKAIADALRANPEAAVALEALKAQRDVAASLGKGSNTMILPTEATGLFGALGALKQFKGFTDSIPSTEEKDPNDDPIEPS